MISFIASIVLAAAQPSLLAGLPTETPALADQFRAWLDENAPSLALDIVAPHEATTHDRWIEDTLQVLSPDFCAALEQFDRGEYTESISRLNAIKSNNNPYLAAYSRYYLARARVAAGLLEEAESQLVADLQPNSKLTRFSPFAERARLLLAHAQFANLRYEDAETTLAPQELKAANAPEYLRIAARQLNLELERREKGTLAEVAAYMDYSADRLDVEDSGTRLQSRQDEIIAMLDKMIKEKEQQEQQQQSSSSQRGGQQNGRMQPNTQPTPNSGRDLARGKGEIGDLHSAPKADPGEAWGNLPPAEREKVLERLKQRYPSRYRQLVEQYYRSMAEDK